MGEYLLSPPVIELRCEFVRVFCCVLVILIIFLFINIELLGLFIPGVWHKYMTQHSKILDC